MKKVYFVDTKGFLSEYEIVSKERREKLRIASADGCDLLIENNSGIYSGSSENYRDTKKEALEIAEKRGIKSLELYTSIVKDHKIVLKRIQKQLKELKWQILTKG